MIRPFTFLSHGTGTDLSQIPQITFIPSCKENRLRRNYQKHYSYPFYFYFYPIWYPVLIYYGTSYCITNMLHEARKCSRFLLRLAIKYRTVFNVQEQKYKKMSHNELAQLTFVTMDSPSSESALTNRWGIMGRRLIIFLRILSCTWSNRTYFF